MKEVKKVYNFCVKTQRFTDILQWTILASANVKDCVFPHGIDWLHPLLYFWLEKERRHSGGKRG